MSYLELAIYSTLGIISLALVAVLSKHIYHRFDSSRPNQWLLVINDGILRKSGIGISIFRGFNETVVKFPSLLNKVTFSAKQVSKEMQGIELSGFIIWVVNRENDGPLKAYRHISNISNLNINSPVNQHLKSMAESIVRHQIANLGIHEVISQRKKVRDATVGELQEILSGWGIWLETVEITEVKILSGSLFNNLQEPFRSSTRETAENIKIESQFKINAIRNEKDIELSKQREEIKRRNIEMTNKTFMLECKSNLEIQKEKQTIQLDKIENHLKMEQLKQDYELKKMEDEYAVDSKMTRVNMNKLILKTVENIYKNMNVDSMKIVNFGENQNLEHGIGKMAVALREIGTQLNDDK